MLIKRRAQSTLEYALIAAVVAGGLIAMQVYLKRGLQGKLKSASDELGEQYSPGYTTGQTNVTSTTTSNENLSGGVTTSGSNTTQNRQTSEDVDVLANEYWGQ
ncbi:MAG: hypothetical protein ABIE75_02185 [Candidatus Omnitrophota bacterium]